jgi:RNA-directed DNA polymerase
LLNIFDMLFWETKQSLKDGKKPKFYGLLEIASSEANIIRAIHRLKENRGSNTPGCDDIVMKDILQQQYHEVIEYVKKQLKHYNAKAVCRVYLPKPGKDEKRPLGIPTIGDRIIQQCIRQVIEPILEAQFFEHSYGFRPMRDAHQAIKRVNTILFNTRYVWVIEGDISKFFDNVNHRIMLKQLYNMGIRDRRILQIIKQMLEAGIMNEVSKNALGTPQGGIISPLLANAYLHRLDHWITREWENKKTHHNFKRQEKMYEGLRKKNFKPAYYVRYADDWVLITNSKENAEKLKYKISKYLETNLKLKLSEDKTLITDVSKRNVKFLGFNIKVQITKNPNPNAIGRKKFFHITRTSPQKDKFDSKVKGIAKELRRFKRIPDKDKAIHHLNVINSQIRGIINYYQICPNVGTMCKKYSSFLDYLGRKHLKRYGAVRINCQDARNLLSVHQKYNQPVTAIKVEEDCYVALTNLSFANWEEAKTKNQNETPYTTQGRKMYEERTNKKLPLARADELFNLETSRIVADGYKKGTRYNFEYYMNRGYVVNRDKFKCSVCKCMVSKNNIEIHHKRPYLPIELVNKVANLTTLCISCHYMVHDGKEHLELDRKTRTKLNKLRDLLIQEKNS